MRRFVIALISLVVLAGAATAQSTMAISFVSDDLVSNTAPTDPMVDMYILIDTEFDSIAAYECSVMLGAEGVFVLSATGPNGWTNFGSITNQIVGFTEPLPADGWTLVCEMRLLLTNLDIYCPVILGPYSPSSFDPPAPGIANGENLDEIQACTAINGYINGEVAVESVSLSSVKALFQ